MYDYVQIIRFYTYTIYDLYSQIDDTSIGISKYTWRAFGFPLLNPGYSCDNLISRNQLNSQCWHPFEKGNLPWS